MSQPRYGTIRNPALRRIIREYTYEAGVRNLEREIGRVCRKVARRVVVERFGEAAYSRGIRVTTSCTSRMSPSATGSSSGGDSTRAPRRSARPQSGVTKPSRSCSMPLRLRSLAMCRYDIAWSI